MGEAVRESKAVMKEVIAENKNLSSSFKSTVNELAKLEKGSIAWETRLKYLQ
jgi:hypothetical protein